jgi:hypothetical protein
MSNTHGDLFTEVGKLVLAANSGQAIDLSATSRDLAKRFRNLGMTEEMVTRVVARSIGAISYSMTLTDDGLRTRLEALRESAAESSEAMTEEPVAPPPPTIQNESTADAATAKPAKSGRRARRIGSKAKSLFPSGVRLALLS